MAQSRMTHRGAREWSRSFRTRVLCRPASVLLSLSLAAATCLGVTATALITPIAANAITYNDVLNAQKKAASAKAQDAKLKQQLAGVNKDLADKILELNDLTNNQIPAAQSAAYQANVDAAAAQQAAKDAADRLSTAQNDLANLKKQIDQTGKDYDLARQSVAEVARQSMHGSSTSDAMSLMTGSTTAEQYQDSLQAQAAISRKAADDADSAALDLSTSLTREQRLTAIESQISDLKTQADTQNAAAQKAASDAQAVNDKLQSLYEQGDSERAALNAKLGQIKSDEAKQAAEILVTQSQVESYNQQWQKQQQESASHGSNNGQQQGGTKPPSGGGASSGGGNGAVTYPAYNGHPTGDVGNAYEFSQCTWWAYVRRHQLGLPVGSYFGNGGQWANSARRLGYQVDSNPAVGAIMVFAPGQNGANALYGHVAIVERVNSDGTVLTSNCGAVMHGTIYYQTVGNVHAYQYIHN